MNFSIKKNTTIPSIKIDLEEVIVDFESIRDRLKNAVATFSMFSEKDGNFVVLNANAQISVSPDLYTAASNPTTGKHTLSYKWNRRDTKKSGYYKGEFGIQFMDEEGGSLSFGVDEPIYIAVIDSALSPVEEEDKTPLVTEHTPMNGPAAPTNYLEKTHGELKVMKSTGRLKVGAKYLLTDYQALSFDKATGAMNFGEVEQLILTAISVSQFDVQVQSISFPQDIIQYDFDGDALDNACALVHKGVMSYRKDTVKNNSAHLDWRGIMWETHGERWVPIGVKCRNVSIGYGCSEVIVGEECTDITIGENCKGVLIPAKASTIKIGSHTTNINMSGAELFTVDFELENRGNSGTIETDINFFNNEVIESKRFAFAMLPAGYLVSSVVLYGKGVDVYGDATVSMGTNAFTATEVFEPMFLADIEDAFCIMETVTGVDSENSNLLLTIDDMYYRIPEVDTGIKVMVTILKG
jgi:hypothetical protein